MQCPVDGTTLLMSERQGIEIDYCPECRGIWLDRGELDKLLERGEREDPRRDEPRRDDRERDDRDRDDDRWLRSDDRYSGSYRKKKKKGWLGDILEFD